VQRGANLRRELEPPQVHVPQPQIHRPPRLPVLPDGPPFLLLRSPRDFRPARLRPPQRARRLRAVLVRLLPLATLGEGGEEAGGGALQGSGRLPARLLALLAAGGAAARGGSLPGG
jgi:hypothetical protein